MIKQRLKRFASSLPVAWQQGLKRRYFARQIARRKFTADEPEFEQLPSLVSPGDWAIDIGANVGHYSLRLSELVGPSGRVISFEPVPATFELLAATAALSEFKNISLVNAAASQSTGLVGMAIPKFSDSGLDNYYMAQITENQSGSLQVLCLCVDSLQIKSRIRLVKIDAEGHELSVLHGMLQLLTRDHPTLIVEDNDSSVSSFLAELGYRAEKNAASCNVVFRPVIAS